MTPAAVADLELHSWFAMAVSVDAHIEAKKKAKTAQARRARQGKRRR